MNVFAKATKSKFRYPSGRGPCNTEGLWDLSLTQLDGIYRDLRSQVRVTEDSLLAPTETSADKVLSSKIEVVKAVVTQKQTWATAAEKAAETKQRKQRLLSLIDTKENEKDAGKSLKKLREELAKL